MAYDRNAYGMLTAAVAQTQQRIAQLQAGMKANPAGAAMYKAAIAQEQQRLASYQQGVSQQQASVPVDNAGYQQQKSDIGQQRHSRQLGDFNTQATQQRNTFDSPYLQRGMFRSGVRRSGLQDMRKAQTSAYGNMVGQQTEELGNLAQQRTQLMANRTSALSAVDRARQKAIFDYLQGGG